MIHTADPAAFFTPLDRFNERWHELNEHPNWLFFGDKYTGIMLAMDRLNVSKTFAFVIRRAKVSTASTLALMGDHPPDACEYDRLPVRQNRDS